MTLVRTLIDITYGPLVTGLGTADETAVVDAAIYLLDQDAFAAAAVPDLTVGDDVPPVGYVYRTRRVVQDQLGAAATPANFTNTIRILQDLKSMRRIGNAELVWQHENNASTGNGFTLQFHGIIRCLFKLA